MDPQHLQDQVQLLMVRCVHLQVAWQSLVEESGEGSVMDDSGAGKASLVGAVLTPNRAMLVSLALLPLASATAAAAGAPFTSCLWLGPALLLSTASHQVQQSLPQGLCHVRAWALWMMA